MRTEIKGDYSGFPSEIREQFRTLQGAVCGLRESWEVYHRLFISDKQRTQFLADQLGAVLGVFQDLLQDDIILAIARLTDPDSYKMQANLSLRGLLSCVQFAKSPGFDAKVTGALNAIEASASKIRKHRHKRIAHSDLPTSLNSAILPEVTFAEIRAIIESIEAFQNLFNLEFIKSTFYFECLSGDEITGRAEMTAYKAKAYEQLEAEGVVSEGEWARRFREELSKR